MALNISSYVDPGVYIGEEVVPGQVSLNTVPLTVCLVGIANRSKRALNEAITHGMQFGVSLSVDSTPSAHDADIGGVSNRKSAQTTIYRDDVALDSSDWEFLPATHDGLTLTTLNFTTNNKLSFSMDGKQPITISIADGGGDSVTVTGSVIAVVDTSISNIAAITAAEIAAAINLGLGHSNATALGYGPSYGAVASAAGNIVTLTSPISTSASAITFYAAYPTSQSQTDDVFTASSLPYQVPTLVRISNDEYDSLSAYTIDYVEMASPVTDEVENDVESIVRVGAFAGVSTYAEGTDFEVSTNELTWLDGVGESATLLSSVSAATYDISTNDTIMLSVDGKAAISIDLNGLASPPAGYTNPVSAAAATGAEIIANINAVLAASATYGPAYRAVATFVGGLQLQLESPNKGTGSYIELAEPTSLSAVTALFGLASASLPYSISGEGSEPSRGAIYFATYEFERDADEYNLLKRFFTPDSLYQDIGYPAEDNQLAIAGSIAFENGAPAVFIVQVDDENVPGSPLQSEILEALVAAEASSSPTEIIVLDTRLAVQVDLFNHVTNQSSPTEKHYRAGWFGMDRDTEIGDRDTPGTFVYMATRTLLSAADSPGRGRMQVVAPAAVDRDVTLEDGSVETMELDGSYLAVAVAARMTAFSSPSETLLRKTVTGFNIDTFPTYLPAERKLLAQDGVIVVTLDAGRLLLTDPITTEAGGGRLPSFQEISARTQKDATTVAVTQIVDANLVGVVPTDLSSFIFTVKGYIAAALVSMVSSGAIGPFRTPAGVSRDIDLSKDVQVFQDPTDPTKFFFKYFYNLRYPAKRFFGTFTVDNPF
jgi:hypothetical protein